MAGRIAGLLGGLVLVAGGLAACGGDEGDDGDGGERMTSDDAGERDDVPDDVVAVDTDPAPVTALDNTFRPENIAVPAGTEVVWTNRGRNEHNVLSVEGEDWGVEVDDFGPGATYAHRFDDPGVYHYYCSLHGTETAGMIGTLVVSERGEDEG